MKLTDILSLPTTINGIHERYYAYYHLLNYVEGMIMRNDSKETILDIIHLVTERCSENTERIITP